METNGEDIQESRNALPDVSLVSPVTRFDLSNVLRVRAQRENYKLRQLMSAVITPLNNVTEGLRHEPGKCLVSNCAMLLVL